MSPAAPEQVGEDRQLLAQQVAAVGELVVCKELGLTWAHWTMTPRGGAILHDLSPYCAEDPWQIDPLNPAAEQCVRLPSGPVAVINLLWGLASDLGRTKGGTTVVVPARYAVAPVTIAVMGHTRDDRGVIRGFGFVSGATAGTYPHRTKGDCLDSYGGGHGRSCGFEVPLTCLDAPPA